MHQQIRDFCQTLQLTSIRALILVWLYNDQELCYQKDLKMLFLIPIFENKVVH